MLKTSWPANIVSLTFVVVVVLVMVLLPSQRLRITLANLAVLSSPYSSLLKKLEPKQKEEAISETEEEKS